MAILALEGPTIGALGSSQKLLDAYALVKELIDNAYDARATAIFVEISQNTLNIVQVVDNGHGIPPKDRTMIGQPHCTSKLASIEDLTTIGGNTLGFRGEALNHAIELASRVGICTKCEGDCSRSKPASHPVGTTVRVIDLLKNLPVRSQTALKETTKCINRIKSMLQAYALARPRVRLSFKILNSKTGKDGLSFVPPQSNLVADAVLSILGKDVASQCFEVDSRSKQDGNGDRLGIHALLPKPDADVSKISNKGIFLSIDGRPILNPRGTAKELGKLFEDYVRKALCKQPGDKLANPFARLAISCPPGSYDPNVEPTKDDLLFMDPSIVLSTFENLLNGIYGDTIAEMGALSYPTPRKDASSPHHGSCLDGRDIVLAPPHLRSIAAAAVSAHTNEGDTQARYIADNERDKGQAQLYIAEFAARSAENAYNASRFPSSDEPDLESNDSDDMLTLCGTQASVATQQQSNPSLSGGLLNNPWTKARLNAPPRPTCSPQPSEPLCALSTLIVRPASFPFSSASRFTRAIVPVGNSVSSPFKRPKLTRQCHDPNSLNGITFPPIYRPSSPNASSAVSTTISSVIDKVPTRTKVQRQAKIYATRGRIVHSGSRGDGTGRRKTAVHIRGRRETEAETAEQSQGSNSQPGEIAEERIQDVDGFENRVDFETREGNTGESEVCTSVDAVRKIVVPCEDQGSMGGCSEDTNHEVYIEEIAKVVVGLLVSKGYCIDLDFIDKMTAGMRLNFRLGLT
ncbi:MAG: hypothetical protein M1814_006724 [Vezdaea aestivalis]|nr:MAG: hypothetical protein M1814_006724 [Vezdaea aestivalis]